MNLGVEGALAPVLFLGHGSPMNAVANSAFTGMLAELGKRLPRPTAVCCVSAHWQTRGVHILESPRPKTIHDFGGFPKELYDIQYPAPGSPAFARETSQLLIEHDPRLSSEWGLDHGTWSVLRHVFPDADVPIYQVSLDLSRSVADHFLLAKELMDLRKRGVWIVGSGNIVHNLRTLDWQNPTLAFEWAEMFDTYIKDALVNDDMEKIIRLEMGGSEAKLSVPTLDHYLPLLYVLGVRTPRDRLSFPYEGFEYGSISMRAVLLENK